MAHKVKQGDTEPQQWRLWDHGGPAVFTDGDSVRLTLVGPSPDVDVKFAAELVIVADGLVEHRPEPTDFDTPGFYDGEFKLTRADGSVRRFPSSGAKPFEVVAAVAP